MNTSIILHTTHNEFTPEQMIFLAELAKMHKGIFRLVATGIQISDISMEAKKAITEALPTEIKVSKRLSVNSISVCKGKGGCKNGFMETMELAKFLEDTQYGRETVQKLRIGIAGCPRCCSDPLVKDIGVYGLPDGFTLTAGGSSGNRPKPGEILAKGLSVGEAKEKISYLIDWYIANAMPKEHFDHMLVRLGNPFQKSI